MVKLAATLPLKGDGSPDPAAWQRSLTAAGLEDPQQLVPRALALLDASPRRDVLLARGIELANLVFSLKLDAPSAAAALLYRLHRSGELSLDDLETRCSKEVAALVGSVARMADSSLLEMSSSKMQAVDARDQVQNIRHMLVAMIDDARVAILKLAERVVALRAAKTAPDARKRRIAQEALMIFAPLANRLGVWHLKWELEDLALRYLDPDVYRALAKQLDGRRAEREAQVAEIAEAVQQRLHERGIEAQVYGRAKHIFSIWKKMRAKNVGLDEVYDQRAVRVIVPDIGQCYSALGVVHTEWQHIPTEFDDYVAVPKENGYRSIHTAVIGDDGKTLEVQIRTPEMHEEAELGVCAHWAYKDSAGEDDTYAEKMSWLRRVVELQDDGHLNLQDALGEELRQSVQEERIFVYTPKGHVLDLTTGATALDFAYRVHTEVGNHCVAARVDGKDVALNAPLETGQRVEIVTNARSKPKRLWLEHHLAFIATGRAREKLQDYFRSLDQAASEDVARTLLESTFARIGESLPQGRALERLAQRLGFTGSAELLRAVAVGEVQTLDVVGELTGAPEVPSQLALLPDVSDVPKERFAIEISAHDRAGLLLDVTSCLRDAGVSLDSNSGSTDASTQIARIAINVQLTGLSELLVVVDALRQIPDVIDARRSELQRTS